MAAVQLINLSLKVSFEVISEFNNVQSKCEMKMRETNQYLLVKFGFIYIR